MNSDKDETAGVQTDAETATQEAAPETEVKRGPGRPPGAKNKRDFAEVAPKAAERGERTRRKRREVRRQRATDRSEDQDGDDREVRFVVQEDKLRVLLTAQRALPAVDVEEFDRRPADPNRFPPAIQRLVDEKRYYFIWARRPDLPGTAADQDLAQRTFRALNAGGLYDVATRANMDSELPDELFGATGAVQRGDQLACYMPWAIWEAKREAEREMAREKTMAISGGTDDSGQIPGVSAVSAAMGRQFEIPGQPGADAEFYD